MVAKKQESEGKTFGAQAVHFHEKLITLNNLPLGITALNPFSDDEVKKTTRVFFGRFFNDTNKRVFVLGINPGRFGSGVTGIPFTDPIALRENCGIECASLARQELTSKFVYTFIEKWGGAESFYQDFFLTSISPIGFIRNGVNFNYYDNPDFFRHIKSFIVRSIQQQLDFGARKTAIILGTGKNLQIFQKLNSEFSFFHEVLALEHPRFIMQYRRKYIGDYIQKYKETFARALSS